MGSSVSLFNVFIEISFSLNSFMILFALSSINSKSLSSNFGPGLYDIVISLGKEEVERRLGNKIIA